MLRVVWVCCFLLLEFAFSHQVEMSHGWTQINLDSIQGSLRIDSLEIDRKGVFDDAKTHSSAEKKMYQFAENIHIRTKSSVVDKLINFKLGDSVDKEMIRQNERELRLQRYFADAHIDIFRDSLGRHLLKVNTSDKWTLSVPLSYSKPGRKVNYSFGAIEFNVLGLGYEAGVLAYQTTNVFETILFGRDPHFLTKFQELFLAYNFIEDGKGPSGFNRQISINKPFFSLDEKYAWVFQLSSRKINEYYFEPEGGQIVGIYNEIKQDTLSARWSIAEGKRYQSYFRFSYDGFWRGSPSSQTRGAPPSWQRNDGRVGFYYTLREPKFGVVKNFKSLKWSEDIDLGWQTGLGLSYNHPEIGANQEDFRIDQHWSSLTRILGVHWVELKMRNYAYSSHLNYETLENLHSNAQGTYWFRPNLTWATQLSANYGALWKGAQSEQLMVGGANGWAGVIESGYTGHEYFWAELEQRYTPGWELGTVLPSLAAFGNGGNMWRNDGEFNVREFDYRAGVGLRFALSKSAQGIVQHINTSWNLNGKQKGSMTVSLIAKIGF